MRSLEAQLDAEQDIGAQLAAELKGKAAELAKEREALAAANAAKQALQADLAAAEERLAEQEAAAAALQGLKAEAEAALKEAQAGAEQASQEAGAQLEALGAAQASATANLAAVQAAHTSVIADLEAARKDAQDGQKRVSVLEAELAAAQASFERRLADNATEVGLVARLTPGAGLTSRNTALCTAFVGDQAAFPCSLAHLFYTRAGHQLAGLQVPV